MYSYFIVLAFLVVELTHSQISGFQHGSSSSSMPQLPCIRKYNQLYCDQGGFNYPMSKIENFIDENKSLIKRMYGTLVQEQVPQALPQTPASTTFVRSVRQFGRFKRSTEEGFLEDFLFEDEFYNDLDANFTALEEKVKEYEYSLHFGRTKRQAGFPGADSTGEDKNRADACESKTEVSTPFWATNSNGDVRAIVNTKTFSQAVHQEICTSSRTIRCAGDCQCEQKYKWHRLLAYDPNDDCSGIFMDWFLFPSCCACRCLRNPLGGGIRS